MNKAPVVAPDIATVNAQQTAIILQGSLDRWIPIYRQTFGADGNLGRVLNVSPRYIGLLKRFIVKLELTVNRAAAPSVLTRTRLGPANILSQVVLTDLSGQNRIQTQGWHLHMLATARRAGAYGAAFANDSPIDIGANIAVMDCPAAIETDDSVVIRQYYEIPVSYGDMDLRGTIYAGVVNATMNIGMTFNPNFCVAAGSDPTLAVFQSSNTDLAEISAITVTVYQNCLDQIPTGKQGPILPQLSMATAYLINNTIATGMSPNQDFAIPYSNFRDFMSTFVIYDQNGAVYPGTDINYFALRAANYTEIWQLDPITLALLTRNMIGDDFPTGMYYMDHRKRPINTVQYGNMELIMQPNAVAAGSVALVGYEALALINQVTQAGSLYNT